MENVVLVIHLILALSIIGLVLIQRSEGGGLGIGGGGGGLGGFASARSTANALTKTTTFLAICFFITSLTLAIMAGAHHRSGGILDTYAADSAPVAATTTEATTTTEDSAASEETETNVAPNPTLELNPEAKSVTPEPQTKPSVPIGE